MTEQQRKAIEILNKLHAPMVLSEDIDKKCWKKIAKF